MFNRDIVYASDILIVGIIITVNFMTSGYRKPKDNNAKTYRPIIEAVIIAILEYLFIIYFLF